MRTGKQAAPVTCHSACLRAAAGATVHSRRGGGGSQSIPATGTVTVAESGHFEYYASAGTSLSAIRSHHYLITRDVDADSDGDRVPDAI